MVDHRLLQPTMPTDHQPATSTQQSAKQELEALLRTWTPPALDANGFLPVENAFIMEAKALRRNFTEIAAMLPGRSANHIQRQWNYLVVQVYMYMGIYMCVCECMRMCGVRSVLLFAYGWCANKNTPLFPTYSKTKPGRFSSSNCSTVCVPPLHH